MLGEYEKFWPVDAQVRNKRGRKIGRKLDNPDLSKNVLKMMFLKTMYFQDDRVV